MFYFLSLLQQDKTKSLPFIKDFINTHLFADVASVACGALFGVAEKSKMEIKGQLLYNTCLQICESAEKFRKLYLQIL